MSKEGFITIAEWMLDLDLNTTEMLAFALICGINMHANSDYHGSVAHLARWCRVSERQTRSILRKLVETGYLNVEKYPGKTDHYTVREEIISGGKKLPGREEIISGVREEKISYDNIVSDNIEDKIDTHTLKRQPEKIKFGERVEMTQKQYDSVLAKYGPTDTPQLIQILDDYLINHPTKKVLDAPAAIRNWVVDKLNKRKIDEQHLKNAQEAAQRVNAQQQTKQAEGPDYAEYYRQQQRWNELLNKGKQS